MESQRKADLIKVIQEVKKDCVADANNMDGKEVTGKFLGTMFGNVLAMVDALAGIIEEMLKDLPDEVVEKIQPDLGEYHIRDLL